MKIANPTNDTQLKEKERCHANIGYKICPHCGNSKCMSVFEAIASNVNDAIEILTFRATKLTMFGLKTGNLDTYKCKKCGTEWESEIY